MPGNTARVMYINPFTFVSTIASQLSKLAF